MFKFNKKLAMSFVELLIMLAIVGALVAIYQKTVNRESIAYKIGYKTVLNNMKSYASTVTNGYKSLLPDLICDSMFSMFNTIGEKNCGTSIIPDVPNIVTTNGMRFFGLESQFVTAQDGGQNYLILSVDVDGIGGDNKSDKDIFSFELMKDGKIRPSGAPVVAGNNSTLLRGNAARDPEIYSVMAYYVPKDAKGKEDYENLGNRLSFAEAQCLTGNPFPYRARNGEIQMCIEDSDVREDIDNGSFDDSALKDYWDGIRDGSICNNLYGDDSVATGLVSATDEVIENCEKCYQAVYKEKFCNTGIADAATCEAIEEEGSCKIFDSI